MTKISYILKNTIFLLLLTICAVSCSSDPLEQMMQTVVCDPTRQTAAQYAEMSRLILSNPDTYADFITENGNVDAEALQKALDAIAQQKNIDFTWNVTAYGRPLNGSLRLRLLLERSGSMSGYDPRSGSGNFKRTLNELITRFPADNPRPQLFIVNDSIYEFGESIESFLQNRDVFSSTNGIGDASFTDFARIFNYALNDTVCENITILISDLIYSPHDINNVSSSKILNESSSLVRQLFSSHPDKEVRIVKLSTDFDGTYYSFDSPATGFGYKGNRPYYLMIIGSATAMEELNSNPAYASFIDFANLPGYENEYRFNRISESTNYFTVIPPDTHNDGNYYPDGAGGSNGANTIRGIEAGSDSRSFTFRIAADFSNVKADSAYICNVENFRISRNAELTSIRSITPDDLTLRNRRYMKEATHLLEIRADAATSGYITIELLNRLPGWINTSDTKNDSSPYSENFSTTTFGLESMLEGIYHAFYGNAKVPASLSMKIKLEK